jgi:hypothetical protein
VTYKSVSLMCDSSSAICLARNPVFHKRAKHIKVRYHFLRDHFEKGGIVMKYIDTERQLADIFTKHLDATHFASLRGGGGTWCLSSLCLGLRGSLCFPFYILYLVFHHTAFHLSIASHVILACIYLIMLIIVLGLVEMRCETLLQNHAG